MILYTIKPHPCGHGWHLTGNGLGVNSWTATVEKCMENAKINAQGETYEVKILDAKGGTKQVFAFPATVE